MRKVCITIVLAGLLLLPAIFAYPVFIGLEVGLDSPRPTAAQLADQAADNTKYLVALATAVLGLVGLLMGEKLTDMRRTLTRPWRYAVAGGALMAALSLWTGFVAQQVVLRVFADAVVRYGLDYVLWLHALQAGELALGVGLVGATILKFVLPD